MSRQELYSKMDAKEVLKWMAYEASMNPETQERLLKEIRLEHARLQTSEDEAKAIKAFFSRFNSTTAA